MLRYRGLGQWNIFRYITAYIRLLLSKKPQDPDAYRMGNRLGKSGQFLVRLLTLKDDETPWLFGKGLAGTRFINFYQLIPNRNIAIRLHPFLTGCQDPITRSPNLGHRSGR